MGKAKQRNDISKYRASKPPGRKFHQDYDKPSSFLVARTYYEFVPLPATHKRPNAAPTQDVSIALLDSLRAILENDYKMMRIDPVGLPDYALAYHGAKISITPTLTFVEQRFVVHSRSKCFMSHESRKSLSKNRRKQSCQVTVGPSKEMLATSLSSSRKSSALRQSVMSMRLQISSA
uniref:Uncharacterized protein n=1 Tax=Ditylenchus dipsaci TaxID=166011 RepID=A0A915D4Z6_9BILA